MAIRVTILLTALLATILEATPGPGWRARGGRVDAQIAAQPLAEVLAVIAAETGWHVYLEPDTRRTITASFRGLPTTDALRRTLDGLSFALLPRADEPSALFVFRGTVADATQRVAPASTEAAAAAAGADAATASERIVVLKSGSANTIAALARRLGATVVGAIDGLQAYRLRFESADAARAGQRALAGEKDVASVEANQSITAPTTLEAGLGAAPPLALQPEISPASDRVIVGLIDTAVQSQGSGFEGFLQSGISVHGDYQTNDPALLHGTAMARTILDTVAVAAAERGNSTGRVALSILPIDVYGGAATTDTFSIAQGLYEALNRHVNVINLSLGGYHDSPLIRQLTQSAAKHGVVVVAAAGNDAVSQRMYPAADPGVIAVTASDARGAIASYANRGPWVDAIAPGDNIVTVGDRTWSGSGTSFASSRVSGWAAGYLTSAGAQRSAATRLTLDRWRVGTTPRP